MNVRRTECPSGLHAAIGSLSTPDRLRALNAQKILNKLSNGMSHRDVLTELNDEHDKRERGLRKVVSVLSNCTQVSQFEEIDQHSELKTHTKADFIVFLSNGQTVYVRMSSSQTGLMRIRNNLATIHKSESYADVERARINRRLILVVGTDTEARIKYDFEKQLAEIFPS